MVFVDFVLAIHLSAQTIFLINVNELTYVFYVTANVLH